MPLNLLPATKKLRIVTERMLISSAPFHLEHRQHGDEDEAEHGKDDARLMQVAQRDEGGGVGGDDARVLQRDDREEEADADR